MEVPKDIAEQYSRMIEVQFWRGNQDQCHEIVDLAFREALSRYQSVVDDDTSISQLFDQKIVNALESVGVLYVRDFEGVTKEQLSSIAQFGTITIASICEVLSHYGFTLRDTKA